MEKLRKLLVTAGGVIYLLFGIVHGTFWMYFSKVQHVDPAFVKITQMLNLGCMVFFCALGFVFLRYRKQILTTSLGNGLLILSALFFIVRLSAEFFFPPCAVGLVATLTLVSAVYLLPVFIKTQSTL
jgi:hypothetical protein